jgi:outer membrane protein assembly factor BamB
MIQSLRNRVLKLAVLAMTFPSVADAETLDFASWRGANGSGAIANAGQYPTEWSNDKNIAWRVSLPGRGASTPIIIGNQIILTAADDTSNQVICIDSNGKQLWSLPAGVPKAGKHQKATGANPSPVSDGHQVFSYFKSGEFVACDMAGKKAWEFNLQERYGADTLWWDLGTSPVLTDDAVVIAVMQSGPSYLVALDKKTGEELWKADRQFNVNDESNQAYTTPAVTKIDGETMVLSLGADHLTAHDAHGKRLFDVGGFNPTDQRYFRSIASPVVAEDIVICPYARGESLTAIRLAAGLPESDRIAWKRTDIGTDVPTPAVFQNKIYLLQDKGAVACLDAKNGKTLWEGKLPKHRSQYSSSPVYCDGKLYCTREDATTFVVDATGEFKVLAENKLEGSIVATPVLANGKIYLRTYDELVCIGK